MRYNIYCADIELSMRKTHALFYFVGGKYMDVFSALAIGASLAADAMAVSVCCGIKKRGRYIKTAVITAAMFGIFQTLMPVLGWSIGRVGSGLTDGRESVVSAVIFIILGVKMLYDSVRSPLSSISVLGIKELLLLSAATSMDALAAGTVLPLTVGADSPAEIFSAALIIGAITFILSYAGFCLGSGFHRFKPSYAERAGGIILIILGIKAAVGG